MVTNNQVIELVKQLGGDYAPEDVASAIQEMIGNGSLPAVPLNQAVVEQAQVVSLLTSMGLYGIQAMVEFHTALKKSESYNRNFINVHADISPEELFINSWQETPLLKQVEHHISIRCKAKQ